MNVINEVKYEKRQGHIEIWKEKDIDGEGATVDTFYRRYFMDQIYLRFWLGLLMKLNFPAVCIAFAGVSGSYKPPSLGVPRKAGRGLG
jgi:hypothetical protein